jgi:hypothetical protein
MKRIFVVLGILVMGLTAHAKTLDELISAERYKLNDSTTASNSPTWSASELTTRNNYIQRQIAKYARCIYVSSITTPITDVKEYSKPPKCIVIDRVSYLQTTSTASYKKLEAITMGGLDVKLPTWENNSSGKPLYYYERGNKIGFERAISATYASTGAIKVDYYKYPDDMTTGTDYPFDGITDIVDLYSDIIVLGVVASCKEDEGKFNESQAILSQYIAGINSMIDTLNSKPDQSTQHISIGSGKQ